MMLVFGVLGMLSCFGSFMLKETKGRKMEDNLEPIYNLSITEEESTEKIENLDEEVENLM